MNETDKPDKFPIPWASSAGTGYIRTIPTSSKIGITNGQASLPDGWPPLTFLKTAAGGVPPDGRDANGILYQITDNLRCISSGMSPKYDSTFSSSIGGYPKGSLLQNTAGTNYWISTVDNNATNPDSGGAGWKSFVITASSDPTFADNSVSAASTGWIRSAMGAIMRGLGYESSFGASGYIKFPSCFGGFMIQWGQTQPLSAGVDITCNFPRNFPSICFAVLVNQAYTFGSGITSKTSAQPYGLGQFIVRTDTHGQGNFFIAVGL